MSMRTTVIERELRNFASDVVAENAKWDCDQYVVDWYKIDENDRNKILAYFVELNGKDFYAIVENDEKYRDDILSKMLGMIKGTSIDSELDFAYSVREAVNHYYEPQAIELIDELTGEYTHDTLRENGLRLVQDKYHGDFVLQRI